MFKYGIGLKTVKSCSYNAMSYFAGSTDMLCSIFETESDHDSRQIIGYIVYGENNCDCASCKELHNKYNTDDIKEKFYNWRLKVSNHLFK